MRSECRLPHLAAPASRRAEAEAAALEAAEEAWRSERAAAAAATAKAAEAAAAAIAALLQREEEAAEQRRLEAESVAAAEALHLREEKAREAEALEAVAAAERRRREEEARSAEEAAERARLEDEAAAAAAEEQLRRYAAEEDDRQRRQEEAAEEEKRRLQQEEEEVGRRLHVEAMRAAEREPVCEAAAASRSTGQLAGPGAVTGADAGSAAVAATDSVAELFSPALAKELSAPELFDLPPSANVTNNFDDGESDSGGSSSSSRDATAWPGEASWNRASAASEVAPHWPAARPASEAYDIPGYEPPPPAAPAAAAAPPPVQVRAVSAALADIPPTPSPSQPSSTLPAEFAARPVSVTCVEAPPSPTPRAHRTVPATSAYVDTPLAPAQLSSALPAEPVMRPVSAAYVDVPPTPSRRIDATAWPAAPVSAGYVDVPSTPTPRLDSAQHPQLRLVSAAYGGALPGSALASSPRTATPRSVLGVVSRRVHRVLNVLSRDTAGEPTAVRSPRAGSLSGAPQYIAAAATVLRDVGSRDGVGVASPRSAAGAVQPSTREGRATSAAMAPYTLPVLSEVLPVLPGAVPEVEEEGAAGAPAASDVALESVALPREDGIPVDVREARYGFPLATVIPVGSRADSGLQHAGRTDALPSEFVDPLHLPAILNSRGAVSRASPPPGRNEGALVGDASEERGRVPSQQQQQSRSLATPDVRSPISRPEKAASRQQHSRTSFAESESTMATSPSWQALLQQPHQLPSPSDAALSSSPSANVPLLGVGVGPGAMMPDADQAPEGLEPAASASRPARWAAPLLLPRLPPAPATSGTVGAMAAGLFTGISSAALAGGQLTALLRPPGGAGRVGGGGVAAAVPPGPAAVTRLRQVASIPSPRDTARAPVAAAPLPQQQALSPRPLAAFLPAPPLAAWGAPDASNVRSPMPPVTGRVAATSGRDRPDLRATGAFQRTGAGSAAPATASPSSSHPTAAATATASTKLWGPAVESSVPTTSAPRLVATGGVPLSSRTESLLQATAAPPLSGLSAAALTAAALGNALGHSPMPGGAHAQWPQGRAGLQQPQPHLPRSAWASPRSSPGDVGPAAPPHELPEHPVSPQAGAWLERKAPLVPRPPVPASLRRVASERNSSPPPPASSQARGAAPAASLTARQLGRTAADSRAGGDNASPAVSLQAWVDLDR